MIEGQKSALGLTSPLVFTSNNGAHPPEVWAEMITNKILYVGDSAHPAIKAQAEVFRNKIKDLLTREIKVIIETERAYFK